MWKNGKIGERRYQPTLKPKTGWPELTALIDVLFLTLLFFALSNSFVRVSGIGVELPRTAAPEVADIGRFVVTVVPSPTPDKSCLVYFQDRQVTLPILKERLFKLTDGSSKQSIIICADKRVPFDVVSQIMAMAGTAKLSSFIVLTPPETKQETRFEQ